MKEKNKEKIIKALKGEVLLNDFQPILNEVITDEITTHPQLSDSMKSFGNELVPIIRIPIDTVIQVSKVPQSDTSQLSSSVIKAGAGAAISILSMTLLGKKHPFMGATLGFMGALMAGIALNESEKPKSHFKERQLITSNPDEIEELVDKLLYSLEVLEVSSRNAETKEPVATSFGDKFPNIIKWLQNIYLETESYGEECAKTMRRQIERILKTVYCTCVHYDGKNDTMFEIYGDSNITDILELFPAIVAHSGKVYPGLVNKPYKN